jgi:RimJ/RimL family protein N-acetyltransferase
MLCTVTKFTGVIVVFLEPELTGQHVRLEPLGQRHAAGLAQASAGAADLYRMTTVPTSEAEAARYVALAEAARTAGTAAPFAVIRLADEMVIGSTRLWDLQWWPWPEGHPRHRHAGPDTCEIGHTWLATSAIRTGANTEMKRLMLTFAFETWDVESVCFHTDARNERSSGALRRIGAQFEGILRSHRLAADARPRDSARYSITAGEWPGVRAHLEELSASGAAVS